MIYEMYLYEHIYIKVAVVLRGVSFAASNQSENTARPWPCAAHYSCMRVIDKYITRIYYISTYSML